MYIVGEEEIEAIAKVIRSGKLFHYGDEGQCATFERRYAAYLGADHFALSASGTFALMAGLTGMGVGPGDEVIVPAHTYMATATAVLAVGAIPLIVDVDESITLNPKAVCAALGPNRKAIIPVHMWGATCDMDGIMEIARKHALWVLEDCCQGVGGSYKGRKLGTIGHAGAFSFNYYKNIASGEGGGLAANDPRIAETARCAIDPCGFYWQGKSDNIRPFAGNDARASEVMGAMLNVQLDRLDGMIEKMRAEKKRIIAGTHHLSNLGLQATPLNSPEDECATQVMFLLPSEAAATRFSEIQPSVVAGKTGRHTYTQWDSVLSHQGAAHPALNPYNLLQNQTLRRDYSAGMCATSLEILNRTVMVATSPLHTDAEIDDLIHNIDAAARVALEKTSSETLTLREVAPVDERKFDRIEH
jgi:dTDP-4-amino-4,6-dideoxygalactose transaminase